MVSLVSVVKAMEVKGERDNDGIFGLDELVDDEVICFDLWAELEGAEPSEDFLSEAGKMELSRDPVLFWLVCCPGG